MTNERIAAIIPALDEARTIGDVVAAVSGFVDEVVVVNDGSTDRTAEIARESGATVLDHESSLGYDRSIDDGFVLADELGATIAITVDADGQHSAADIPRLVGPIQEGTSDVVVGIRPEKARISEHLFSLYTRSRLGVVDPLCGMKAYRMTIFREVGYFDERSTIGTQLMMEAKKRGFRVTQLPISLGDRQDQSRFGQRLEANWKILRALGQIVLTDLSVRPSSR